MDTIIKKISDIESAAASIMDSANTRKKEFARNIEEKTKSFDAALEAETEKKISDLRTKMEVEMRTKLSQQQLIAEDMIKHMEENYNNYHSNYAMELFQAMLEE